jgi:hypothetical protein
MRKTSLRLPVFRILSRIVSKDSSLKFSDSGKEQFIHLITDVRWEIAQSAHGFFGGLTLITRTRGIFNAICKHNNNRTRKTFADADFG